MSIASRTPKLRFSGFSGEWEVKKLGDIADIKTGPFGSTLHEEDYVKEGTPIITVENLNDGVVTLLKTTPKVSERDKNRLKSYWLRTGDIVFSRVGSVDRSAYVTAYTNGWLFSGRLLRVRPEINAQYLNTYLQKEEVKNEVRNLAVGGTMPSLNTELLGATSIKHPGQSEQEKIAGFLTVVDERIAVVQKRVELLLQYKKGVMQKIFTQQLRFSDNNGRPYPDWLIKKFDDTMVSLATKAHQVQSPEYRQEGKYPIVDQGQKYIVGYSDDSLKVFNKTPVIIFGDHTTFLKYIDFDFIVGADGTKILQAKSGDNLRYLFYYLEQNQLTPEGYKRHYSVLRKIKIGLPAIEEQQKIANFLASLEAKVNQEKAKLKQAKLFKKSLLQRMFV